MAKIKKNSFIQGLSGRVGDMVFRQMPDGSTRVSAKPDSTKRTFNQEQKGNQDRFGRAVAYARAAKSEPVYTGLARQTGRTAYHLALADALTPPAIQAIEWANGRVQVTASDDVMVIRVQVTVLDPEGRLLEEGEAAQPDPLHTPERWEYATRAQGTTVEVTAWDLADNPATATS